MIGIILCTHSEQSFGLKKSDFKDNKKISKKRSHPMCSGRYFRRYSF